MTPPAQPEAPKPYSADELLGLCIGGNYVSRASVSEPNFNPDRLRATAQLLRDLQRRYDELLESYDDACQVIQEAYAPVSDAEAVAATNHWYGEGLEDDEMIFNVREIRKLLEGFLQGRANKQ